MAVIEYRDKMHYAGHMDVNYHDSQENEDQPVSSPPTSVSEMLQKPAVRVAIGIFSSVVLFTTVYAVFGLIKMDLTMQKESIVSPTPIPTIDFSMDTPTPRPSSPESAAASTAPANKKLSSTPVPTNAPPTATFTPVPPTNTPQPTATPIPPDETTPVISLSGPASGSTIDFRDFCFPVYATDNQSQSSEMNIRHRFDSASWTDWGANWSPCFSGVSNGQHTFTVEVRDKAGNVAQQQTTFTVNASN